MIGAILVCPAETEPVEEKFMAGNGVEIRVLPRSPRLLLADLYNWTMAIYYAVRLSLSRRDTALTYRYCRHLDRVSYFRGRFRAYLADHPESLERWKSRRLFVDEMPDPEAFGRYAEGTVGRCFYEMNRKHAKRGLPELREMRLETLPEERKGLDLEGLRSATDPEDIYERIVARRNIFMTSTHDLCHMLTGSPTDVEGEAVCAKYQYQHLLVPQNWMNLQLSMLDRSKSFKFETLRRIRACFPEIERSVNYSELDFNEIWHEPLLEARRRLGLPEEGFRAKYRPPDSSPVIPTRFSA